MDEERILHLPQVKDMVGLGTTAIYERIKRGGFPKQIEIGRLSGWLFSEVQAWITEQVMKGRTPSTKEQ